MLASISYPKEYSTCLVHGSSITIKQNLHAIVDDFNSLLLSEIIFSAFYSLSQNRLCKMGTKTGGNGCSLVSGASQINVTKEAEISMTCRWAFYLNDKYRSTYRSPLSTPPTTRAFQRGLNLDRRLYMTLQRYSKMFDVPRTWPSSWQCSLILLYEQKRLSIYNPILFLITMHTWEYPKDAGCIGNQRYRLNSRQWCCRQQDIIVQCYGIEQANHKSLVSMLLDNGYSPPIKCFHSSIPSISAAIITPSRYFKAITDVPVTSGCLYKSE